MTTPTLNQGHAAARLTDGIAGVLAYAAAPAFALMAVASTGAMAPMAMCPAAPGFLPFDGMTTMYLLMCVFHLRPWLQRFSAARSATRH